MSALKKQQGPATRLLVQRVRTLCAMRGLPQASIPAVLGIDRSGWCRLANGERGLTLDEALLLATWANVPLDRLISDEPLEVSL